MTRPAPELTLALALGIVLIGRNEGARLERALLAVKAQAPAGVRIVYVDSGSTDDSVKLAQEAGAEVVELTSDRPFTAARARNAGFAALVSGARGPKYVQFIDGDCALVPGWLEAGQTALDAQPDLGLVTGWRSESHRDASVYNALCDFEWHRPAGDILTCGGDMLVRVDAFQAAGGFDEQVIAAEDDDFCVRLGKAGWRLHRLAQPMTRHDAAMTSFAQWWRRAIRSGHGFAQVGALHPGYFMSERRRVLLFGAVLPAAAILSLLLMPVLLFVVLGLYAVSYWRGLVGLRRDGLPFAEAAHHAMFLSLSKFPNAIGMAVFHWRSLKGHKMNIIEYK